MAILLLGSLALPLAAQQFDEKMWGKNSSGVELAAHESPREHDASGTVLLYNLLGKGFPADKTYDLWFWIAGKKPQKAIAGVSFDKLVISGSLVGNQTLKFSGAQPANTVAFANATIEVVLNYQQGRQNCIDLINPEPAQPCPATTGIYIFMSDANLDGHPVTGVLDIADVGAFK